MDYPSARRHTHTHMMATIMSSYKTNNENSIIRETNPRIETTVHHPFAEKRSSSQKANKVSTNDTKNTRDSARD